MHEDGFLRKRRSGAALCLAMLLAVGGLSLPARAAETPRELVPVGHTVGIKMFARGVLVVDLAEGKSPAKACGLAKGDVILQCNGTAVTSTEQFQRLLQGEEEVELAVRRGGSAKTLTAEPERNEDGTWVIGAWIRDSMAGIGTVTSTEQFQQLLQGEEEVELAVRRGGSAKTLTAEPEQNEDGAWVIGAWIRDSMAGIGTVTYYDPATGAFGALGHGVTDTDTAQLLPFASGSVLPSTVKAVKRGQAGAAGELKGNFDLTTDLGTLRANTASGIFGALSPCALTEGNAVPVAESAEVRDGPAVIRSNVAGDSVKDYQVELRRLGDGEERNLLVTVTDPELLSVTGGIVQGMSGSPILQNGKLVGAVTHVLLNDPTKGYGIFIENMLKAA